MKKRIDAIEERKRRRRKKKKERRRKRRKIFFSLATCVHATSVEIIIIGASYGDSRLRLRPSSIFFSIFFKIIDLLFCE